ncbi:hypothetical protein ES695_09510 [Candidatus Atribacteria bacterium 1244-E10-H5-B2]|nr:MAG: hypothetical protein ES695_09510 [Candidatus Atribacteria bacterium 1244-E10-H5-B2]
MNKNKKITRRTIDLILAVSDKLRREMEHWEITGEKDIQDIGGGYIYSVMLNFAYNILVKEGYSEKYLDEFFFNEGELDKHKEWTEKARKFYHIGRKDPSRAIKEFFNENPAGVKLRMEINKLSEKFNQ